MPKMKRSSTAKKRFRWTGSGSLIKRSKAYKRHLLNKKTTKRKRQLRGSAYISEADKRQIARILPY